MQGTSTLYRTCPSHLPVLGKLLDHLKARLASTEQPRKVAADRSKFPAEDHNLSSMEHRKSHKPETLGEKAALGIQGEELPPSLKKHAIAKSKHVLPLFTTAVKARAPGRPAGLAQEQTRQCGTRQTSPRGEGALERHSWELGCSSIQRIIPISAYRFVSSPLLLLSFLRSTLSSVYGVAFHPEATTIPMAPFSPFSFPVLPSHEAPCSFPEKGPLQHQTLMELSVQPHCSLLISSSHLEQGQPGCPTSVQEATSHARWLLGASNISGDQVTARMPQAV